jgi:HAD superfamily hydrolase (TIGR01509 family)
MAEVKAVVFDVGNILIHWDAGIVLRPHFASDEAYQSFLRETRVMWMNLQFDAGLPFEEGLGALVARFPHYAAPLRAFRSDWPRMVSHAIADNVATLEALKTAGHTVYAITNFARETFDIARVMYPFLDLFDHALVSADIGLVKPDYRIYHRLCEAVGLEPEEMIFVDDSALNIAAAKAVGYHVFHMPKADAAECAAFRAKLKELGFRLSD